MVHKRIVINFVLRIIKNIIPKGLNWTQPEIRNGMKSKKEMKVKYTNRVNDNIIHVLMY